MSQIPEDLKDQYARLQRQMSGSKSQARQAKPIAGLIERIAALTADREAWRERHDAKEEMRLEDEATIRALQQRLDSLSDPAIVHANILRGTIALTKAQAIHIAGLPADVEEQLAEALSYDNRHGRLVEFVRAFQSARATRQQKEAENG